MGTPFLEVPGSGGFVGTKRTVTWVTALASLANGATSLSDGTADTGIFSQATFGNARKLMAYFVNGTASFTPIVSGNLSFWWVKSTDGGGTFEDLVSTPSPTVPPVPGTPDFVIPFDNAAFASGKIRYAPRPFWYPYVGAKLVVQNNTGVTLSTTGTPTVVIGAVEDAY